MSELIRHIQEHPTRLAIVTSALAAGAIAKSYLRPEYDHGDNYFDIIANTDECIRAQFAKEGIAEDTAYVVLGGGPAAALQDPRTIIDPKSRTITPPDTIWKPQYREGNNSLADVDILAITTDENAINTIRRALTPNPKLLQTGTPEERIAERAKPGARLKVGVTGLMSAEEYTAPPTTWKEKVIHQFKKDWISQRLESEDGKRYFAISDIMVELPDEYFEPWHIVLKNGETIPSFHPLVQVLSYASRASHGIRDRDVKKVIGMMNNIGSTFGAYLFSTPDQKKTTITGNVENPGVAAALEFCNAKNSLPRRHTAEALTPIETTLLAARMAIHRQLDTRPFFVKFGQGGPLYDKVLSRFSGEQQHTLEHS